MEDKVKDINDARAELIVKLAVKDALDKQFEKQIKLNNNYVNDNRG